MAKVLQQPDIMPVPRTVAFNSTLLAIATVVTKVLTFTYILIIARYLGPELFGKYSFAYSFVAMLSFGSELGLASFTVREVAGDPSAARRLFSNMFAVRLLLALATFAVVVSLGQIMGQDAAARLAVLIFAVAMVLDAFAEGLTSFFFAFQRMLFPSIATIFRACVVLGAVVLFAHAGLGLGPIVGATVIGAIVTSVILGLAFARQFWIPRPDLQLGFLRTMLWTALPYAGMALITNMLFRIDIVMLSVMKGDVETGLYGAAYRIMESLLFISTAVNSASLPAMSRVLAATPAEIEGIFQRSFRWLVWLGLPMAVGLTLVAEPIMGLFGAQFKGAAPCLQVLAWALLLMFVNRFTGTLLTAAGWQRLLVKICAVALVANVLLNLLLIPKFGRMGAAWVTLLCECGLMPALLLLARRYLDLRNLLHGLWRPCLAAAAMAGFCWYFNGLPLAVLVSCGAAVYGIFLVATYLFRRCFCP